MQAHPAWNSVLCEKCDQIFERYHALVLERSEDHDVKSETHWWHGIHEVRHFAARGCGICTIVSAAFKLVNHIETVRNLEQWRVRLTVDVVIWSTEGMLRFLYPSEDPGPEPLEDLPSDSGYTHVATDIIVQRVRDHHAFTTAPVPSCNTGSRETIDTISKWLQLCNKHELCKQWPQVTGATRGMPSRLVEITSTSPTDPPTIRLVLADELSSARIAYATLSHCWEDSLDTQLLTHNFDRFRTNIDWKGLPLTFQHAVEITAKLDLRYIWIDALCILQNSHRDWTAQSAAMTQVYANSTINISADASRNGHQGLYRERDPDIMGAFLIKRHESSYCCIDDTWFEDIDQAPLGRRAWVVQERFMAPRVIHFGQHQVHFECAELFAHESVPCGIASDEEPSLKMLLPGLRNALLGNGVSQHNLYELWDKLIYNYAHCDLTYLSDRPIAIAGLAQTFCGLLKLRECEYVYGMWRPRFIHELMWFTHVGHGSDWHRLPTPKIPTWSWLSVSCGIWPSSRAISMHWMVPSQMILVVELLHLELPTLLDGREQNLCIAQLRAHLCEVEITGSGQPYMLKQLEDVGDYDQLDFVIKFGDVTLKQKECFDLRWDDNSPEKLRQLQKTPLYLMLGHVHEVLKDAAPESPSDPNVAQLTSLQYAQRHHDTPSLDRISTASAYDCLILEPTERLSCFRRVGYVQIGGPNALSVNVSRQERLSHFAEERTVLDVHFLTGHVPTGLYDDVDDHRRFTFSLI